MEAAHIGSKPVIFASYSLGGLLTKLLLLENEELAGKTQSIMFMGTPHKGSDAIKDTKYIIERHFSGFHPFMDSNIALPIWEFTENLVQNFAFSKTCVYACNDEIEPNKQKLHQEFIKLNIPFHCVAEGQPVS